MDRQIIYVGQIPQDTDLLLTNKNIMVALGYLMQAVLGTATLVDGMACTPTSPATLTVNVAGGSIYSLTSIDATAYGSIAPDTTDQIVKQGIVIGTQNFACPAPVTGGQSVVYLVEAAYQDTDIGSTVLPYYNASNPAIAYNGPNNTGVSQATIRQGLCKIQVKTGVAATTGTQVTPTPDAGFTGLFAVTVANGQATITSPNIVQLTTAPFINPKLASIISTVQGGSSNSAHDTSVSANTITIALTPAPSALTDGMKVRIKVANTVTGATVINTNTLGNVSVVTPAGTAFTANTFVANGFYDVTYDANGTRWIYDGYGINAGTTENGYRGGVTTGTASAQVLASLTPATGFSLSNNGQTIAFTSGFAPTGTTTLQITSPAIAATAIKKPGTGGALVNLTGNEWGANETVFIAVNTTAACYELLESPPLGTVAVTNLDTTNFTVSGGNLAAGSGLLATIAGAPLASPALTGTPTVPTASTSTNTTQAASCAFVQANKIMTALGVGSIITAHLVTSTIAAGATIAAAGITPVYDQLGTSGGVVASGDSITGTWQALVSNSSANVNYCAPFQRTI